MQSSGMLKKKKKKDNLVQAFIEEKGVLSVFLVAGAADRLEES